MFDLITKLNTILEPKERRNALILFIMMFFTGLVEMTGVASVIPFLAVMATPKVIESNRYLAWMYDYFNFQSSNMFLICLGCGVFVVVVSGLGLNSLTQYATIRYTRMRGYSLSARLMKAYLSHPYSWFLDRHSADLGKTILSEVEQVISGVLMPFAQLLTRAVLAICLIGLLVVVNPLVAISATAMFGLSYGLVYTMLRQYLTRIGQKRIKANQERFQVAHEAFGGIKEVKAAGLESGYIGSFEKPARGYARYQSHSQIISAMPRSVLEMISFGGILIILITMLFSRQGNVAEVLPIMGVFAFAGQRLLPAVQSVYQSATTIKYGMPALDALHKDMVDIMPGIEGQTPSMLPQDIGPMGLSDRLELKQVDYVYPKSQAYALKNVTLKIIANTTVGFVGSTGAGKTTAVDVILGLLPPRNGLLIVDGKPIFEDNLVSWQRTIGYVPQQIFLADDTITANIAFGIPKEKVDVDAVMRAAKIAELHEFVERELQNGYDTLVGERGVRLSGGQRQRIGIARAMYHDPDVLIMDEATSALDNLTERAVMGAVHHLGNKKTVLLIAHRLSTVKNCDTIFLLERGELKAQGTYEELLRTNEAFKAMAEANE